MPRSLRMPRRLSRIAAPALSLLVLLLATSCGGGGGGGGNESQSPPEETGFRVVDSTNGFAVSLDAEIFIEFSEEIQEASAHLPGAFRLQQLFTGKVATGVLTVDDDLRFIRFKPGAPLARDTRYSILVTDDVTNRFGERLAGNFEGSFHTVITTEPPPPPPPPPPPFEFVTLNAMNVGRSSHTLTRLTNGRVLVAGGFEDANTVGKTAEIYDPATRSFARVGDMVLGRAQHTASLLPDGRVLITGGLVGNGSTVTGRVEIFDPSTGTFSEPADSALTHPRAWHTASTLEDDRILIVAGGAPNEQGQIFNTRSAEIYDPTTGQFKNTGQLAVFRSSHQATRLLTGEVLVTGGSSSSLVAEIYDPDLGTFSKTAGDMIAPRSDHTATLRIDGSVVVYGGGDRSASIYDPVARRFNRALATPLADRTAHTATRMVDGRIMISGGYTLTPAFLFHATAEFFTTAPDNRIFFADGFFPAALALHEAILLTNGDILLCGGANVDPTLKELSVAILYTRP